MRKTHIAAIIVAMLAALALLLSLLRVASLLPRKLECTVHMVAFGYSKYGPTGLCRGRIGVVEMPVGRPVQPGDVFICRNDGYSLNLDVMPYATSPITGLTVLLSTKVSECKKKE